MNEFNQKWHAEDREGKKRIRKFVKCKQEYCTHSNVKINTKEILNKYHLFAGAFHCWPPAFVSIRLIISLEKAAVVVRSLLLSILLSFYSIQIGIFRFSALSPALFSSLSLFASVALPIFFFFFFFVKLNFSLPLSLFLSVYPLICTSCFKIYESLSLFISLLKRNNVYQRPEAVRLTALHKVD